ncbi:MFS transporter, FHS family, L-fucose permease [Chitinophaga jiangningensis]|uniref:MFS transporter, FHS family, L-fucose permease n=1 Tax=Chitinophaga jiangningensis TaxID=1419482 RepID=A0A1M7J9H1_9BACT|nr:sugar MFS transporter [Chitinophaga jiangningensis]SHM49659.1 MFS transporter, FHS family, L-fucose permease [Chitinophaga jiangningensis]
MSVPRKKTPFTENKFIVTFIFVTSLFLLWGVAHSMSDVLNRHFQNVLNVSKSDSGLIQLSVFGAYFVMSIPAGMFMKRFGYKYGVLFGLSLFSAGMLLFIPAADKSSFGMFRLALFILGCGMATLETVAHPFVAMLGDQRTSDARINFSQSFNAVGAMIGPAIGTYFLLRETGNSETLGAVKNLYAAIGIVIALVAVAFAMVKVPALNTAHAATTATNDTTDKRLFSHRHFVWAAVAQFFNVAAQAGTWTFFINYGHDVMGFSDEKAGNFMVLFMAFMAGGRFIGTWLMRYIAPNKLLATFSAGSIIMCLVVAQGWGWTSYACLFMINFFFSIMFPTIFSLGLKNLGGHTQQASSFISMGVVGGAFFPLVMGKIANHDVAAAYYLPIVCYLVIFLFAAKFYKVRSRQVPAERLTNSVIS